MVVIIRVIIMCILMLLEGNEVNVFVINNKELFGKNGVIIKLVL